MKPTPTPFHKSRFAKIYQQMFGSMMSLIRFALVTAVFFAVMVIIVGEQIGSTASKSTPPLSAPPLSAPPPTCTQPPSDVIAWWSGEGNGSPEIGTHTAVLGNGAQYGPGVVGQAFQFDGVIDFVDIGQQGALPTYTVALWFNADIVDQNRTFISQDRAGTNDDFMLGIEPEGHNYINDFRRITVVFHDDVTQSRYKIRDTVDADPGRWYFVAVTYDGTTMRLWVDGVEKGNVVGAGLGTSDQQWNLGQNSHYFPSGSYRNFAGRIDEPIIASRAFTQSELNAIYLSGPAGICRDNIAPTTNAVTTPLANGAGWNNSDVSVSLASSDNAGGTGVSQIAFSATGAQPIDSTTVNGASVDLSITAEGETTITYSARDAAGNEEAAQSLVIKIDKSAPSLYCDSADGIWHANDVSIPCTANDGISGLSNAADGSFNLSTNVPPNTETTNASTNSRTVCDVAGNCETAGPITGNNVDKKAPTITITAPSANAAYLLNHAATSNYGCSDSGSGVSSCVGPVANGSNIDTASTGAKTFTVKAIDQVGNTASQSVSYSVGYGFVALYDQTKVHKSGSTIPIKIQLVDANGVNQSSASLLPQAVSVVLVSSNSSGTPEDAGSSNPDFNFRYDGSLAGYIFNLKTTGFVAGTHELHFVVGDTTTHVVQFRIRP